MNVPAKRTARAARMAIAAWAGAGSQAWAWPRVKAVTSAPRTTPPSWAAMWGAAPARWARGGPASTAPRRVTRITATMPPKASTKAKPVAILALVQGGLGRGAGDPGRVQVFLFRRFRPGAGHGADRLPPGGPYGTRAGPLPTAALRIPSLSRERTRTRDLPPVSP